MWRLHLHCVSENESMLHVRHCLGVPTLMIMIENRCCKFMDRLLGDGSFMLRTKPTPRPRIEYQINTICVMFWGLNFLVYS